MITWRFKPNMKDDMDVDPIQGEFFTTRDIDNISTAVVREGIQNALDEIVKDNNDKRIRVRIFLSGDKYAVPSEKYLQYIKELIPHLNAIRSGIKEMPDFNSKMKFLVFEDFNTGGLEGDPAEPYVQNPGDGKAHNFYFFWRNVGRSGKTNEKLGRWGLGKTVFPASSQINTFWGFTVRKTDSRKLLMGQSILRIHNRLDDKDAEYGFKPYGMFGNFSSDDCFVEPIESNDFINEFRDIFKIERSENSGLSLIIPFVSEEIKIHHLLYAVLEQYFYPILKGILSVDLAIEDNSYCLEKDNLLEVINSLRFENSEFTDDVKLKSKENILALFDLAKWSFTIPESDYYKLNPLDVSKHPAWLKSLFSDTEALNKVREKFEQGERIAIKVPVYIKPIDSPPVLCWYDVFMEKDNNLKKPENIYVRDGITISGIVSLEKGPVRGMVIIHDPNLANMLGDSENPAHTEWQPDSRNFKGKYIDGKKVLNFIKGTLKKLYENLQMPPAGLQRELLIDFFSIPLEPEPEESKPKPKARKEGNENKEELIQPDLNIQLKKAPAVIIEKTGSGFKLLFNKEAEETPEHLEVLMGYDVPSGDPIKSYQKFDFDVSQSPIKIISKGAYLQTKRLNHLEIDIENKDDFFVEAEGFDPNRDLYIKLKS